MRQTTTNQLNWLNAVNGNVVLVIGMKVWLMVWRTSFNIHADDNSEESSEFRQGALPNVGFEYLHIQLCTTSMQDFLAAQHFVDLC